MSERSVTSLFNINYRLVPVILRKQLTETMMAEKKSFLTS